MFEFSHVKQIIPVDHTLNEPITIVEIENHIRSFYLTYSRMRNKGNDLSTDVMLGIIVNLHFLQDLSGPVIGAQFYYYQSKHQWQSKLSLPAESH